VPVEVAPRLLCCPPAPGRPGRVRVSLPHAGLVARTLNASTTPVYIGLSAGWVCSNTFRVSNGCPTATTAIPATVPAATSLPKVIRREGTTTADGGTTPSRASAALHATTCLRSAASQLRAMPARASPAAAPLSKTSRGIPHAGSREGAIVPRRGTSVSRCECDV
jgi:hypothetical protein